MKITFEVEGIPLAKSRPRVTMIGDKPRMYSPRDTVSYEQRIVDCYDEAAGNIEMPWGGPVWLDVLAECLIPQSWPKWQRRAAELNLWAMAGGRDVDNYGKIVMDSLNGVAYQDDRQVVSLTVAKQYSTRPRLLVEIEFLNQATKKDMKRESP